MSQANTAWQVWQRLTVLRKQVRPGSVIVGFTGDLKSMACLDLVRGRFPENSYLLHFYVLPNASCDRKVLDWIKWKYKLPVLSLPHPKLTSLLRKGEFRIKATNRTSKALNWIPIEQQAARQFGIPLHRNWTVYGTGPSSYGHDENGLVFESQRQFPMSDWKRTDVIQFIRQRRILEHEGLTFPLNKAMLDRLERDHPSDLGRLHDLFPLLRPT